MIEKRIKNQESRIKVIVLFLSLIFLAAACNRQSNIVTESNTATIGGHKLNIEIADNEQAWAQGLSGRDSMAENFGLVFVLPSANIYTFWMKDMKFPLDFIWIKDGKVVELTHNAPIEPAVSDKKLHRYISAELVDTVIEVNAGWAERNSIKVGDEVK